MASKELWGEIKNEESIPQITRAMIELRTPKPFELPKVEPPVVVNAEAQHINTTVLCPCPQTIYCIQLQLYIKKLKDLVNALENITSHVQFTSMDEILALKEEVPMRPVLENVIASSGSQGCVDGTVKDESLHLLTQKSVASIAVHSGFGETDDACLNVLTDVTKTYIHSFAESMRNILDNEALTGSTNFFDAMDSVCHACANSNLPKLLMWWKNEYLGKIVNLEAEADDLEQRLRDLRESKKSIGYKNQSNFKIKKDSYHSEAFSGTYGKWTPVESVGTSHFQNPISYQLNVKTEDPNHIYYPTG